MNDRQYTVGEIGRMRAALRSSYPSGVSFYEHERSAEIENRLRTYMQNGTEPEELEKLAQRQWELESRYGPGVQTITFSSAGSAGGNGADAVQGEGSHVAVAFKDISAQTFGKYQNCTMADNGLWYSDQDMRGGRPERGALPSPRQYDPEKQARADAIITTQKVTTAALPKRTREPLSWTARIMRTLFGAKAEHGGW